jgi:hypothetical protein
VAHLFPLQPQVVLVAVEMAEALLVEMEPLTLVAEVEAAEALLQELVAQGAQV